jgi:hypothetical protein
VIKRYTVKKYCKKRLYKFLRKGESMPSKPYWKDSKFWICPKHLPSVSIPGHIKKCWYAGCGSIRPEKELDPFAHFNIGSVGNIPLSPPKRSSKSTSPKKKVSSTKKTRTKNKALKSDSSEKTQPKKTKVKDTPKMQSDRKQDSKTKSSSSIPIEQDSNLCAWFKCDKDNGERSKARNQSKYCSRDCSNRNARFRMKQRQKDK